ncbi:hypothetical protein H0E85_10795 [Lactiplantibacillus plantarum]|uniref:hypothetical protein n=1 Tax=Lactiplantibacillus plantarum TaxID=1590 RepID=UPI0015EB64C1|nr:hypothetical protein [Lactiplantibacillus plantarum]QLQ49191.1 hypothetical protein H0E85_10795 [Lactiplantibacillus plantarum]
MTVNNLQGVIKFTPNASEVIAEKYFYLSTVDTFLKNSNNSHNKIDDSDEGFAYLNNEEKVSYTEIIQSYSGSCQAYISCFTLLYANDFCEDGKIKRCVANRLKQDNNKDNEQRNVVIYKNLSSTICWINNKTVEFINRDIKKPPFDTEQVQSFSTVNVVDFLQNLCLDDPELYKNFYKTLKDQGFPRNFDQDMLDYLKKENQLEKINQRTDVTLKGRKIKYGSQKINFPDKNTFLSHLKNDVVKKEELEKYLEVCLLEKDKKYREQNEYRLLVTEFNNTNNFPKALKLFTAQNCFGPNVVKYDDFDSLYRSLL